MEGGYKQSNFIREGVVGGIREASLLWIRRFPYLKIEVILTAFTESILNPNPKINN